VPEARRRGPSSRCAEETIQLDTGIRRPHEGLAHQEAADSAREQRPDMLTRQYPALGDDDAAARDAVEQVERAIHLSADKYCSASIMLGKTAEITHDFELREA